MSTVRIERASANSFLISGVSQLNPRTVMKLDIYLNSMKDVVVLRQPESIIIEYTIAEIHAIAKSIQEIGLFLSSQSIDLDYCPEVEELLQNQKAFEDETTSVIESLIAIKADAESIHESFSEFCSFCDSNLVIKLRDYQYKSAFLLSVGRGGFDFSVPGAGKTIISYASYSYMKHQGLVNSLFVVGPGSAYNAWYDEFSTCFGSQPEFEDLSGESIKNCKIYLNASPINHKEITFINFEKIRKLTKDISTYLSVSKSLLIVDEGHKIKNPDASVTESALEIAQSASSRFVLTGTPMPNGYEDLYTLTKVVSPFQDILPYRFNQLKSMTSAGATPKESNMIHESLNPHYSRISKKYLIASGELLPSESIVIQCTMNDEQNQLYQQLNDFCGKLTDDIDEDFLFNLKKAVLIRKMQISANPALLKKSIIASMDELKEEYEAEAEKDGSSINLLAKADKELMVKFAKSEIVRIINKFERGAAVTNKNLMAVKMVEDIVNKGHKVLVWDIFVNNMNVLRSLIEAQLGLRVELVNGSVKGIERQESIKRFREGNSMILLANPSTLAESISLHKACQNAIYVNRNYNAAQFIQSKDRIHRINMPQGTTAHYFFIENKETIDSAISEKLELKERRMLEILDSDDIAIGGSEFEDSNIMSNQDVNDTYLR